MKQCCKCKIEKTLTSFGKCKTRLDGMHPLCKECRRYEYLDEKERAKARALKNYNSILAKKYNLSDGGFFRRIKRHYKKFGPFDKTKIIKLRQMSTGCYFCNIHLIDNEDMTHPQKKTLDHLQPRTRGGDNHFLNLAFVCRNCSVKKYNKTEREYWDHINRKAA